MLTLGGERPVYLACGPTDMRKSIDGLAAMVQLSFQLDPTQPALFVFCSQDRKKLKILEWETAGFWLHYRRLERGRFQWPRPHDTLTQQITFRQLRWILDGLAIHQGAAHRPVTAHDRHRRQSEDTDG